VGLARNDRLHPLADNGAAIDAVEQAVIIEFLCDTVLN
jgi:hypothetical protein